VEYVVLTFWSVAVTPFPRSHCQEVGELVDLSVNCTKRGEHPDTTVASKSTTGFWLYTLKKANTDINKKNTLFTAYDLQVFLNVFFLSCTLSLNPLCNN
jgi:hypothetical protein